MPWRLTCRMLPEQNRPGGGDGMKDEFDIESFVVYQQTFQLSNKRRVTGYGCVDRVMASGLVRYCRLRRLFGWLRRSGSTKIADGGEDEGAGDDVFGLCG